MRKRRSRGTWLPILGTKVTDIPAIETDALTFELAVDMPNDGSAALGIIPITYDFPQEGPALQVEVDTLNEIVGNEYIIKRILGHCHVSNNSSSDTSVQPPTGADALLVSCGFFVARAGADSQGPLGAAGPIGYGTDTVQSDLEQYSPGNQATAREPWMWRRTWIVGNERKAFRHRTAVLAGNPFPAPFVFYPPTNALGSLREGPSVDIKSRRRVKLDERLFFAVECRSLPLGTTEVGQSAAYIALTIRMFGSLVKAKGSGAF